VQTQTPLREGLLRPPRHGEPDQRVSARALRRSHLHRHDAGQPAAAVVRINGLCAALCRARHRAAHTPLASATCGTIRLKLLKIGALVRISVRRIKIAMTSSCPAALVWGCAAARLNAAASARGSPALHAWPQRVTTGRHHQMPIGNPSSLRSSLGRATRRHEAARA
jgi:hypothetical protein